MQALTRPLPEFLAALETRGLSLALSESGDGLALHGPKDNRTASIRAYIGEHKAALVAYLRGPEPCRVFAVTEAHENEPLATDAELSALWEECEADSDAREDAFIRTICAATVKAAELGNVPTFRDLLGPKAAFLPSGSVAWDETPTKCGEFILGRVYWLSLHKEQYPDQPDYDTEGGIYQGAYDDLVYLSEAFLHWCIRNPEKTERNLTDALARN